MLDTEDRPTGPEPTTPRRRSPGRWFLVAAAVAVVAVGGAVLVAAAGEDEKPVDSVTSPPTTAPPRDVMDEHGSVVEPGRYFIDPDGDDTTPLRVTYEIAAVGWEPWFGAVKSNVAGHSALSITTVPNLVTDGCLDHTPADPPVGPTVDDLVTALSQLAPFEVTAPPTDVKVNGYWGKHLELTLPHEVPDYPGDGKNRRDFYGCVGDEIHSWISTHNDGSFYGYEAPDYTEEFWILDVEGTRLVFVEGTAPWTPVEDLDERDAIFDTIQIEP